MHTAVENLLDLDVELRASLSDVVQQRARRRLEVRVVRIPEGGWAPASFGLLPGSLGLLVTDGVVLRRVQLGHRTAAELLGAGDLLQPWQENQEPFSADWRVVRPLTVAVLDREATRRISRYPAMLVLLLQRTIARSRRMAERCATAQIASTTDRLRIEFECLADRWGRVTPDGIALDLPLTHEILGHLVGTRRQTVTTALGELTRDEVLVPLPTGGWLLREAAPSGIRALGGADRELGASSTAAALGTLTDAAT